MPLPANPERRGVRFGMPEKKACVKKTKAGFVSCALSQTKENSIAPPELVWPGKGAEWKWCGITKPSGHLSGGRAQNLKLQVKSNRVCVVGVKAEPVPWDDNRTTK